MRLLQKNFHPMLLMNSKYFFPQSVHHVCNFHLHAPRQCFLHRCGANMCVWNIHQYGNIDKLIFSQHFGMPVIRGPTELLIKVHAFSINPIDLKMLGGYGSKVINVLRKCSGHLAEDEFPLIFGRDFSGVVVQTGKRVSNFKAGDEVWGAISASRQGSNAEFIIASESEMSKKPFSLSHREAAALPYVAATSWSALKTFGGLNDSNTAGKRVLVLGGSGGVGSFSIQLLKAWGADVTATSATNAVDLVGSLGADAVVDYQSKDLHTALTRLLPFDFILDTVGISATRDLLKLLKKWSNAKIISIVFPFLSNLDDNNFVLGTGKTAICLGSNLLKGAISGRHIRWAIFLPNGHALNVIRQLIDDGQIRPVIDRTFQFSELPAAYAHVQNGHSRGKTVVETAGNV